MRFLCCPANARTLHHPKELSTWKTVAIYDEIFQYRRRPALSPMEIRTVVFIFHWRALSWWPRRIMTMNKIEMRRTSELELNWNDEIICNHPLSPLELITLYIHIYDSISLSFLLVAPPRLAWFVRSFHFRSLNFFFSLFLSLRTRICLHWMSQVEV